MFKYNRNKYGSTGFEDIKGERIKELRRKNYFSFCLIAFTGFLATHFGSSSQVKMLEIIGYILIGISLISLIAFSLIKKEDD